VYLGKREKGNKKFREQHCLTDNDIEHSELSHSEGDRIEQEEMHAYQQNNPVRCITDNM